MPSQFRTASLERILGDKAEQYFRTMERTFMIAEQKQRERTLPRSDLELTAKVTDRRQEPEFEQKSRNLAQSIMTLS
jgi:hypothetical protein